MVDSESARSLAVQSVLTGVVAHQVIRAAEGIAASVVQAQVDGLVSSWELLLGDRAHPAVLDDGSMSAIRSLIEDAGGTVRHVVLEGNLGSAAGHIALAEHSDAELILFVKPDARIAPDTIRALCRSLVCSVGVVDARQLPFELAKGFLPYTGETDWASTTCAITTRSAFERVAGFDASLDPEISGDADYSGRLRLAGFGVRHEPAARVFRDVRLDPDGLGATSEAEVSDLSHPPVLMGYLEALAKGEHADPALAASLRALVAALSSTPESSEDAPFLSVLLPVSARRLETFRDAVLCLGSQIDESFEVIVIPHDADGAELAEIEAVISRQATSFRDRIKTIAVQADSLGSALNAGADAAAGEYLVVCGDDEVPFANWVAGFHAAERRKPGRLLRAATAEQRIRPELWPQDDEGFRAVSSPRTNTSDFDPLTEVAVGPSPASWAFPRPLLASYGLRFDEKVAVGNDWDLIQRGFTLCGVEEVGEVTAISRVWEGNAAPTISRDTRALAAVEVSEKLAGSVSVLGPAEIRHLRRLYASREAGEQLAALIGSRSWRLARPLRGAVRMAAAGRRVLGGVKRRIVPSRKDRDS